jgi:hypothetical protein
MNYFKNAVCYGNGFFWAVLAHKCYVTPMPLPDHNQMMFFLVGMSVAAFISPSVDNYLTPKTWAERDDSLLENYD